MKIVLLGVRAVVLAHSQRLDRALWQVAPPAGFEPAPAD